MGVLGGGGSVERGRSVDFCLQSSGPVAVAPELCTLRETEFLMKRASSKMIKQAAMCKT